MATDADLLTAYERGASYSEIAARFGLSLTGVRGRISRARRGARSGNVLALDNTDAARWQAALARILARPYVTIVHLSDLHLPYADTDALALAYQCLHALQPDIVVTLSDAFDFPTISSFARDPDIPDDDVLETVRAPWWSFVDNVQAAAPRAVIRAILGNHDFRLHRFLADTAPQIRTTALRAFDDLVRYQGRVLLPDYLSECDIGAVTVMHGNRSTLGEYGARRQLERRKYQRFMMAGHSHNPAWYMTRGPERAVASIVGGCLCQFPHYQKDTLYSSWTQGFAYAIYDTRARYAWLHNAVFERTPGGLATTLGGVVYRQAAAVEGSRAA